MTTTNQGAGSTLLRYLLWQIPGWLLTGVMLVAIVAVTGLSWWIVPAVLVLFVARDVALYPAMRAVFRPASPTRPIGARGIAVADLRPTGMVRVQGELWRARSDTAGHAS